MGLDLPGIKVMADLYNRVAEVFSRRYECPFCQGKFKRFRPYGVNNPVLKNVIGGGYRLNAICPRCKSLDRDRLYYLYLVRIADILGSKRKIRLLHIAPEPLIEKVLKGAGNIEYVSGDLYAKDVMVKMDIINIPYGDNCFDCIICNHVLEHVLDDRKAMSEIYRILKPNRWAMLQVPILKDIEQTLEDNHIVTEEARERAFGQTDHVRIYGADYIERLEQAGFDVELFSWCEAREFLNKTKSDYSLIKEELLYICHKRME